MYLLNLPLCSVWSPLITLAKSVVSSLPAWSAPTVGANATMAFQVVGSANQFVPVTEAFVLMLLYQSLNAALLSFKITRSAYKIFRCG